jgi:hypothetical protein
LPDIADDAFLLAGPLPQWALQGLAQQRLVPVRAGDAEALAVNLRIPTMPAGASD